MNRETILAAAIAVVLAGSLLAALAVPGVIADDSENPRPSSLNVREMTIAPGPVSGSTATLTVDTRLEHRGGPAENVTVLVRATRLDSGLVETTRTKAVPTIDGDREATVTANLSVERRGGYRIESVVYRDGERITTGEKEISGVGTLTPAYARTPVRFHWLEEPSGIPPIEYTVASVSDNRTRLNVSTSLTNQGDDTSERLRLELVARQSDSNIVADRASVQVGRIEPGRTASPDAALTVPDGYNYYLDAVLWKDGVIVASARSAAKLHPTEEISLNTTRRTVGIEVSEFERETEPGADRGRPETTIQSDGGNGSAPGFGVPAAVAALAALALLARRTQQ